MEDPGVIFDTGRPIRRAMFGVYESRNYYHCKQLGYDAVITHHPKGGYPYGQSLLVMENQIDRMVQAGVPINKAQRRCLREKMRWRDLYTQPIMTGMCSGSGSGNDFIAIHTPADIIAESTVQKHLDRSLKPYAKATGGMSSVS